MQNSSPGTEVKHATATPVSVPVMTRKSKCAMCLAHQVSANQCKSLRPGLNAKRRTIRVSEKCEYLVVRSWLGGGHNFKLEKMR